MTFKIKNWKLALLALFFICLFASLCNWQLSRAKQKEALLASFTERTKAAPLSASALDQNSDLRFFRTNLSGRFDNEHTFLLDNKIFHGTIGYEVYTLFFADGLKPPILIDRGFVPITKSRGELPVIKPITGHITVSGMLNLPPAYVALGAISESTQANWPLRVEYIDRRELSNLLNMNIFPFVLLLSPKHLAAYDVEWQVVTMNPERHRGYALQWFAFALTLLILFVVLNIERAA
ncbi:MAG: hypothetical protein A3F14_01580 [Gammaproteobacteria bacterium RIFCSPHIGHO2_12_FULL_43_28]|nr:MAG: hypothetical protein A3F14_01580 [Gammaproteobacteria bacterium RIFCSPHIGHO2_12_FULL_43_28]